MPAGGPAAVARRAGRGQPRAAAPAPAPDPAARQREARRRALLAEAERVLRAFEAHHGLKRSRVARIQRVQHLQLWTDYVRCGCAAAGCWLSLLAVGQSMGTGAGRSCGRSGDAWLPLRPGPAHAHAGGGPRWRWIRGRRAWTWMSSGCSMGPTRWGGWSARPPALAGADEPAVRSSSNQPSRPAAARGCPPTPPPACSAAPPTRQDTLSTICREGFDHRVSNLHGALGEGLSGGWAAGATQHAGCCTAPHRSLSCAPSAPARRPSRRRQLLCFEQHLR